MEKDKLMMMLKNNPSSFWQEFNNLPENFKIELDYLQVIYASRVNIPKECGAKYQSIIKKIDSLIQCKDISVDEKRELIVKSLNGERNPYNFLNIKSRNHYLFVLNFGDIPKELCSFVNRLSMDILNYMNSKHLRIFVGILMEKGFDYVDSVKLAFQVYNVLGFFKGRDFLQDKYGEVSKGKLKSIFGSIDLSEIIYDLNTKEPILNDTVINLMLGESFHVKGSPIKKYLKGEEDENTKFFLENLNLIYSNWDLINREYIRRSNLESLNLRLNIGQIKAILTNIIDMNRDIKRKDSFRGRKKIRYEKIPGFEIRDLPILESDLFDYVGTVNKYVVDPRNAPKRAVELSRMMEGKTSKKFPEVSINEGKNKLFTFHPQDRDIISAGFRTGNCFVPNGSADGFGVGAGLLEYSIATPYGGGIEIRDKVGKTIAFAPILRNGNVLFIHSIEGIKLTSEEKKIITLFIKTYADEVIRESHEKEGDKGIVAVVCAEEYNVDTKAYIDTLDDEEKFHVYDPSGRYKDIYGNFNSTNGVIAYKDGCNKESIKLDEEVSYDYAYSLSELENNHKIIEFTLEEMVIIKDLDEAKRQVSEIASTRMILLKNHQNVLAMELLREISKIKSIAMGRYQELFNTSLSRVDSYQEFSSAYQAIKSIYEETGSEVDFDIYSMKRIYYSDNWFVAVSFTDELYYECISGAEYQFLTVLEDVKKQISEGVSR